MTTSSFHTVQKRAKLCDSFDASIRNIKSSCIYLLFCFISIIVAVVLWKKSIFLRYGICFSSCVSRRGHPSKYWPRSILLNFCYRTVKTLAKRTTIFGHNSISLKISKNRCRLPKRYGGINDFATFCHCQQGCRPLGCRGCHDTPRLM